VRVSINDPALVEELAGFLQRAQCLAEVRPDGTLDVYLAHDLPPTVARAELESYLSLWARSHPGGAAALEPDYS
jgi:hypothetical protein